MPNSTIWRGLFERSEFPSHIIRYRGGVHPEGRAQAKKALGTFAETKVPRRAGGETLHRNKIEVYSRIAWDRFWA